MYVSVQILIPTHEIVFSGHLLSMKDVDLVVNLQNAPAGVKNRLLSLYPNTFEQRAQFFYYKLPSGKLIQIDICADWQVNDFHLFPFV